MTPEERAAWIVDKMESELDAFMPVRHRERAEYMIANNIRAAIIDAATALTEGRQPDGFGATPAPTPAQSPPAAASQSRGRS
jgi:hypothetical protein